MLILKGQKELEEKLKQEINKTRSIFEKKEAILRKKEKAKYELSEILKLEGEEFIRMAYKTILLREPDPSGINNFLPRLLSGNLRKIEILARIKLSKEGIKKESKVKGLWKAILISIAYNIPILGGLIQRTVFFLTLPSFLAKIRSLEGRIWQIRKDFSEITYQLKKRAEQIEERTKKIEEELFEKDDVPEVWKEDLSKEIEVSDKMDFYTEFEEIFRGKKDIIREKQKFYLELIKNSFKKEELEKYPVLDIGCGRGEFLELLKENGIRAIGVDLRKEAISELKKNGFEVYLKDGIVFLKRTRMKFSAISSFHVIEHMDWEKLKEFVLTSKDRLCEGGLLILETPNPWNKEAFARFFLDYTHKRPIVPELLVFLLKWAGFRDIEVYYFSPLKRKKRIKEGLKDLYLDYGVVGRK